MESKAYVYFLRCNDNSIYCGYTTDLSHRLAAHKKGVGAKYTKARLPVSLVYYEEYSSKEEAMSREWHIHHDKKYTKSEKEKMIASFNQEKLINFS